MNIAQRLAKYRTKAASAPAHMLPHYGKWQAWRCGAEPLFSSGYFTDARGRRTPVTWCPKDTLRGERFCDEILTRLGHRGWFTDEFQDETMRGIVARLPHGRFIAGMSMSVNDSVAWFHESFTDEREAAMCADGRAEQYAEQERDYQAGERERLDRDEAREAECGALREARTAWRCALSDVRLLESVPDSSDARQTVDKHTAILRASDRMDRARKDARRSIEKLREMQS